MQLGHPAFKPLHTDRSNNVPTRTDHKEGSTRRDIMTLEREEVRHLLGWLEDETILIEHPPDKPDHRRHVRRAASFNREALIIHDGCYSRTLSEGFPGFHPGYD